MVTAKDIVTWVRPGFFMASVNLTDTYLAIPLNERDRRYTRFKWRHVTYEYTVIVFGLSPSV